MADKKGAIDVARGTQIWLKNGRSASYEACLSDGRHLVQAESIVGYEDDGEPWIEPNELMLTDTVYTTKPVAVIDEEIAARNNELAEVRKAHQQAMSDQHQQFERLAKIIGIRTLELIAAGGITHVVRCESGKYEVLSELDTIHPDDNDRRNRRGKSKLLTLWGSAADNLEWGLSDYRDGSGVHWQAWPFGSEEEALAFARAQILGDLETAEAELNESGKISHWYTMGNLLESAKKYDCVVPEAITQHQQDLRRKSLQAKLEKAREECAKLTADLEADDG